MRLFARCFQFSLLLGLCVLPGQSLATEGFLVATSPPRYELRAEPGDIVREVLTIHNLSSQPAQFNISSSEWDFTPAGQTVFDDALKPGSCRPWLRIERRKVSVAGRGERRFRYELHVPDGTPPQECRLALVLEGDDDGVLTEVAKGVSVPVKGRVAVIIYLAIGDVKPALSVKGVKRGGSAQSPAFSLVIENTGTATGRLSGLLRGQDARGRDYDVSVSSLPVLPGQVRELAFAFSRPEASRRTAVTPEYPVKVRGEIFWREGSIPVNTELKTQ